MFSNDECTTHGSCSESSFVPSSQFPVSSSPPVELDEVLVSEEHRGVAGVVVEEAVGHRAHVVQVVLPVHRHGARAQAAADGATCKNKDKKILTQP